MKIMQRIHLVGRKFKTCSSVCLQLPMLGEGVCNWGGESRQAEGTEEVGPGLRLPLEQGLLPGGETRRMQGTGWEGRKEKGREWGRGENQKA